MTTVNEISEWFDRGLKSKSTHMIIVCDTFDHEDYPVYVDKVEDFYDKYEYYNGKNMQRIMEVYDLMLDKSKQMSAHRVWNLPSRS